MYVDCLLEVYEWEACWKQAFNSIAKARWKEGTRLHIFHTYLFYHHKTNNYPKEEWDLDWEEWNEGKGQIPYHCCSNRKQSQSAAATKLLLFFYLKFFLIMAILALIFDRCSKVVYMIAEQNEWFASKPAQLLLYICLPASKTSAPKTDCSTTKYNIDTKRYQIRQLKHYDKSIKN